MNHQTENLQKKYRSHDDLSTLCKNINDGVMMKVLRDMIVECDTVTNTHRSKTELAELVIDLVMLKHYFADIRKIHDDVVKSLNNMVVRYTIYVHPFPKLSLVTNNFHEPSNIDEVTEYLPLCDAFIYAIPDLSEKDVLATILYTISNNQWGNDFIEWHSQFE